MSPVGLIVSLHPSPSAAHSTISELLRPDTDTNLYLYELSKYKDCVIRKLRDTLERVVGVWKGDGLQILI